MAYQWAAPVSRGSGRKNGRDADEMFPVYQVLIDKEQGSLSDLRERTDVGRTQRNPSKEKQDDGPVLCAAHKDKIHGYQGRQSRLLNGYRAVPGPQTSLRPVRGHAGFRILRYECSSTDQLPEGGRGTDQRSGRNVVNKWSSKLWLRVQIKSGCGRDIGIPERSTDPPTIRSAFCFVRDHRVGHYHDLNGNDQTVVMDPHGPAHPGRKRKRNGTGVGRTEPVRRPHGLSEIKDPHSQALISSREYRNRCSGTAYARSTR